MVSPSVLLGYLIFIVLFTISMARAILKRAKILFCDEGEPAIFYPKA